ncbi:MAG: hypothetical protein ACJARG_000414 [Arcticibacterium sp.]
MESNGVGVLFYAENGSMLIESGNSYKIFDLNSKLIKEVKIDIVVDPRNLMDPSQVLDAFHIQNFFEGIKKGNPVNSDILGGHQSTLLVQLGNISQRVGRSLKIDSKNGHILNDQEAMAYWKRTYETGWEPKL